MNHSLHRSMTTDQFARSKPLTFLPDPSQMRTHDPSMSVPPHTCIMESFGQSDRLAHETFWGMTDREQMLGQEEGELASFVRHELPRSFG